MPKILLLIPILLSLFSSWAIVNKIKYQSIYKILPLVVLIIMAFASSIITQQFDIIYAFFILGLILSLIGDYLLAIDNNGNFFIFGVGSFLLGYLTYAICLLIVSGFSITLFTLMTVFMIIISTLQFIVLKNNIPKELIIPIIGYLFVISLLVISGFNATRLINNNLLLFWVLVGTLLIYLSDSFLAQMLFNSESFKDIKFMNWIVMLTYYGGQIMIWSYILK